MENRSSITSKVDKLSCSVDEVMKLMWYAKSEERLWVVYDNCIYPSCQGN